MKTLLFLIALSGLVIVGCATQNPNWTKPVAGQPDTNTVPQYIVDPRLNTVSNTVAGAAAAAAPVNPYAGITGPLINGVFGLIALGSGYVVRQKNGALATMGQAIVKSGAATSVLAHASNSDHFVAVADSINAATGANQDNTGAVKP